MVMSELSLGTYIINMTILFSFFMITFVKKWKIRSGKIFGFYIISAMIWFSGLFLISIGTFEYVVLGAIVFLVGGWYSSYLILLFTLDIVESSKFNEKFTKYTLFLSALYLLSFFFIRPFRLIQLLNGEYYPIFSFYSTVPMLLLSLFYYVVITIFVEQSFKSEGELRFWYMLFAIGLLIHILPTHVLFVLELLFGYKEIMFSAEYFSLIGFAISLYAYIKGFTNEE